MADEEHLNLTPEILKKASKGLFNFIQVIGVTIRKSGQRGIFESHLYAALTPAPTREEYREMIESFIRAGLVRRVEGTKHNVLYWIGPKPKKGVI